MEVQFSPVDVLGDKTETVGGGERVTQGQQERMVYSLKKKIFMKTFIFQQKSTKYEQLGADPAVVAWR